MISIGGQVGDLVTIECSRPGDPYTMFRNGTEFDLHLAAESEHGIGPCLCGFNRFSKDVGFSVSGGVSGPGYMHHPCPDCAALIDERSLIGMHADLFEVVES